MTDHYTRLGLKRGATTTEIKRVYRKLAKELHPDRNKDNPEATKRFLEVRQAYDILADEDKRCKYDRNEIDELGNPRYDEPVVEEALWYPSQEQLNALFQLDPAGRKARKESWFSEHPHLVRWYAEEIDEPPFFTRPPPAPPPPPPAPPPPPTPPRPLQNVPWLKVVSGLIGLWLVLSVGSCVAEGIRIFLAGPQGLNRPDSPPQASAPTFTVQPFDTDIPFIVAGGAGVRRVNMRSGPGSEYSLVLQVPLGYHLIGNGSAVANDGTVWISVTAVGDNHTGFVAERLLQRMTELPPSNANAEPQEAQPPDVSSNSTRSPVQTPPPRSSDREPLDVWRSDGRQSGRATQQQDVAPTPTIMCILPSGQEVQLSSDQCRRSSGVIYRNDQN